MRLQLLSPFRKYLSKRAFLRNNPDIRRVFGASKQKKRGAAETPALNVVAPTSLSPAQLEHWNDFGFLVLRGFFEPATIDDYKSHIDNSWQRRADPSNPLVMFSVRGGHYFRDAVDTERLQTYRLLDQYLIDARTRDLSMHPRLADILHELMGYSPVVCNTLLFEWGSEQDMHSDMFYMAPASDNQMLATWIAIDDVTDDNGPLVYVPGSHKLPPHRFSTGKVNAVIEEVPAAVAAAQAKISELGLPTERFLAKRGDVLIWHSQLVHGGDAIRDHSARRTSLVTHYFSTCDFPIGPRLCAERDDGTLLLLKDHVALA